MSFNHDTIERNSWILIVLVILVVAVGGLVEIVPLFFDRATTEPVAGIQPYDALRLEGRDIYLREGCYNCHSQMVRPFRSEALRYGHYSVAGESVYDHPFQWGSKRTGLSVAGGRGARRIGHADQDAGFAPGRRSLHRQRNRWCDGRRQGPYRTGGADRLPAGSGHPAARHSSIRGPRWKF